MRMAQVVQPDGRETAAYDELLEGAWLLPGMQAEAAIAFQRILANPQSAATDETAAEDDESLTDRSPATG